MGGMFGGGSKPKLPPKPDPQAIPETQMESVDDATRGQRKKKGYSSNIITGNLAPGKGKKLGGSTLLG